MLVEYDLQEGKAEFEAGQFFNVTLPGALKHHFTIINSPNEDTILSNTTRLRDTDFKNTLRDLPLDTEVEVGEIGGRFILPQDFSKPIVFVALGIGITPYISMLRFIKEEAIPANITLIYSDHKKEEMPFLQELQDYAVNNKDLKIILTITGDDNWKGEKRHVDAEFIKDYLDEPENFLYYISGPPKAVHSVAESFAEAGIPKENIKAEDFTGY